MHALPAPLREKLLASSNRPFSVVVAFDCATALTPAKRLCSELLAEVNQTVELKYSWCQFDQLSDERFAREAVEVAAAADLIAVAAARADDPPPVLRTWMEKSLASRANRDAALAALVGSPTSCPPSASSLRDYLKAAADRSGLAFIASNFAAPQPISALTKLEDRTAVLTPCLEAILKRPIGIPRWGINE